MSASLADHGYETPFYTMEGWTGDARVVDIYDGDTCQLVVIASGTPTKLRCRLRGIDAPEMTRDADRERARGARDRLASLLTGLPASDFAGMTRARVRRLLADRVTVIRARLGGTDKYGRTLVDVCGADGEDVARAMLRGGSAVPFMVDG
jgi:endonuclease YncB( thermonuclease family)